MKDTIEAFEHKPNGEVIIHYLNQDDINEMLRQKQINLTQLASARNKIFRILHNLTTFGWYSDNITKEDVLSDICHILEAGESIVLNDMPGVHHEIYLNGLHIGDKLDPNQGGYIPRTSGQTLSETDKK